MDNIQKIEQLVNKAGCSYEEASAALEKNGWDMLDAVISLERDGKVQDEFDSGVAYQTEPAEEVIPEVTAEVVVDSSFKREDSKEAGSNEGTKKSSKRGHRLWERIKRALTKNRMVMLRKDGSVVKDFPILVPVIALILFFWATVGATIGSMLLGFRFHFEGEDLGKININNTMDKATDYAERVKDDISERVNGKKNSDN